MKTDPDLESLFSLNHSLYLKLLYVQTNALFSFFAILFQDLEKNVGIV